MQTTLLFAAMCVLLALPACGGSSPNGGTPDGADPAPAGGPPQAGPDRAREPLFVYTRASDGCPEVPGGREVFCGSGNPEIPSSGLYDVAAIHPDGGTRVLTEDHISAGGRLSPDGSRIAFASGEEMLEDRNGEVVARYSLYVMDADGTDRRRLADLGSNYWDAPFDGALAWSPDGGRVAFERYGIHGSGGIAVVDVDGGSEPEEVAPEGADPVWSPDGGRIAFTGPDSTPTGENSTVGIVDADGGDPSYLAPPGRGAYGRPRFSPDGELVVFVDELALTREDTLLVARVSDAAPGFAEATTAARTGAAEPKPLFREEAPSFSDFTDFEWSPDGRTIAFGGAVLSRGEPPDRSVIGTVALVDGRFTPLEVGEPGTLGFASSVAWTPDGGNVVCVGPTSSGVLADCSAAGEKTPIAEVPGIHGDNDFDWGPYTLGDPSRGALPRDSELR